MAKGMGSDGPFTEDYINYNVDLHLTHIIRACRPVKDGWELDFYFFVQRSPEDGLTMKAYLVQLN